MRSIVQLYPGPPPFPAVTPLPVGRADVPWPGAPGELAQLGERLLCKQEVTGSNPVFSIGSEQLPSGGGPDGEQSADKAQRLFRVSRMWLQSTRREVGKKG